MGGVISHILDKVFCFGDRETRNPFGRNDSLCIYENEKRPRFIEVASSTLDNKGGGKERNKKIIN